MHSVYKTIGILSGTFDPIHLGHVYVALESYKALNLDQIVLIPSYQPVHRSMPVASPEDRLAMTRCATADLPLLYADAREINRKKPSFTIETLQELHDEMPDISLCLLLGMDAFLGLPTWHRFNELLNFAHIIVFPRQGFQIPSAGLIHLLLKKHLQHDLSYIQHNLAGGILLLSIPTLEISATEIRKQFAIGSDPRYLLPQHVYNYIQQHGTYKK